MHKIFSLILVLIIVIYFIIITPESIAAGSNYEQDREKGISKNQILAISRTNLNNYTTRAGDPFSAKLVEDIRTGNQTVIPAGSIISGRVTKVKLPKRFPAREGEINLTMDQIQTPQGILIPLAGRNIQGKVYSPYKHTKVERVAEGTAVRGASYGSSIPLDRATDLNGGTIYVISLGAAMAAGAAAGFLAPDVGSTRLRSSARRAFDNSPVGVAKLAIGKGNAAELRTGDGLVLNFDKATVAKIQSQYFAQTIQPGVAAAR